jgi:hypothetical protein
MMVALVVVVLCCFVAEDAGEKQSNKAVPPGFIENWTRPRDKQDRR